ncbi:MAG: UvrD-helicase domain-containing protein [Ardenticatenales bacterium]|nr:UvrD-helicase domain-containing protein [Ardenticatenales bacterium]
MKPLEPWSLALDGTHLIEASAGTGKTYTIATLVLRLVLEAGLTIDRILVVTFTRAATAELRDRIRRRIVGALAVCGAPPREPDASPTDAQATSDGFKDYLAARRAAGHGAADAAALAAALRDFDTAPIFTIHSFCQRVLQEFAFESGTSFEATLTDDDLALKREIVADYWASQTYGAPPILVAHLIDTAKVTPATLERLATALAGARGLEVVPAPGDDGEGSMQVIRAHADASEVVAANLHPENSDTGWLDHALAEWHGSRDLARSAFAAGRDDAEVVLSTSAALTHRSLTKGSVPRWLDQIGDWLASDAPPPTVPVRATLLRFTTDGIAPHVKDGCAPPSHPLIDALDRLAAADARLADGLAAWSERIRLGLAPYLTRETRLRRRRANAQAFDDLLHDLAAALEGDRGPRLAARARARYAAALIDEFQDTDDVQYRIFRSLFGTGARAPSSAEHAATGSTVHDVRAPFLALIGDPKQAIYAFRGADVFAYLRAAEDAGSDRRWTLAHNRRSDEGLVRALNAVWAEDRVPQPFVYPGIQFQPVGHHHPNRLFTAGATAPLSPVMILRLSPDDPGAETNADGLLQRDWAKRTVPRRVATDIAALLAAPPLVRMEHPPSDRRGPGSGDRTAEAATDATRPIEPGDIAVLTRTNTQAAAVQRALDRLGIPSVRHGDDSVFETDEAAELARVLAAVIEPGSASLVRGALATRILGADAARLEELAADEPAWEAEVEKFRGWLERWQQAGFIQAYRRIVEESGVAVRLLALPDGERRLTNVQHVAELIHRAAHTDGHGPRALLGWLARMRTDIAARTAAVGDSAQLRLERDMKAVQVVTVHRSKGLEYAVVYCPFLWYRSMRRNETEVRFTDPADRRPKLDIGTPPAQAHRDAAEVDDFAEDMRLAYVALTRAKHHCRIVWGPIAGAERSALGRLCHPTPGPVERDVDSPQPGPAAGGSAARPPAADGDASLPARRQLEDAIAHVARRIADPAAFEADLDALVAAAAHVGGAIAVRGLATGAAPPWRAAPDPGGPPTARRFEGRIPRGRRRTSYSALVSTYRGTPPDPDATRDHDGEAGGSDDVSGAVESNVPATNDGRGLTATASGPAAGPAANTGASLPAVVTLDAFPAGADPGTCLHAIFERIDFTNPALWPGVAADACRRAGIDAAAADVLPAALAEIVATRLSDGPAGFALADVPRSVRLNEMPFVLPIALGRAAEARRPFAPADLAAALATHGAADGAADGADAAALPPGYADAVGRLGFDAVHGHLSGFVDMVCRVGDRWYIVDWKSNRLGSTWADYGPQRIAGAMAHHHYYLQYHLYTVAVHRYLQRRVPGYRYADSFGGVYYLFVRGMHPALGPRCGVFFDRPTEERVARLEAVLEG